MDTAGSTPGAVGESRKPPEVSIGLEVNLHANPRGEAAGGGGRLPVDSPEYTLGSSPGLRS
jgi:hypothetical protein